MVPPHKDETSLQVAIKKIATRHIDQLQYAWILTAYKSYSIKLGHNPYALCLCAGIDICFVRHKLSQCISHLFAMFTACI